MSNSVELREKREAYINEASDIVALCEKEERILTVDEQSRFDHLTDESDKLKGEIDKLERSEYIAHVKAELSKPEERKVKPVPTYQSWEERDKEFARYSDLALNAWIRYGKSPKHPRITPDQNRACDKLGFDPRLDSIFLNRAGEMGSTDTNLGAELVAPNFFKTLNEAQKQFGSMLQTSSVSEVDSGDTWEFPLLDDTSSVGQIVAQQSQETTHAQLATASTTIAVYNYSSKIVDITFQLIQDSAFDIQGILARALGIRLGRITNTHWTQGDGSSKPHGITVGAYAAVVNSPGTGTPTYAKLVDTQDALDPAYDAGAAWMMSRSTFSKIRQIVDGSSRPLIYSASNSIGDAGATTLLGRPVVFNNDMPAASAGNKAIVYGQLSSYRILRVRNSFNLQRFTDSAYGTYFRVGFLANERWGGRLVVANSTTQNPVIAYQL